MPKISCDTLGVVVHFPDRFETCAWNDIICIEAWKRDCVGTDVITLDLFRQDGTTVFVDEEMEGYDNFLASATAHLPTFQRDAWWPHVAFPPFAENRTEIWKRAGGGSGL